MVQSSSTPDPESSPQETPVAYFPCDDIARETNCTVINWMDPINPMGALPICIILLGCSWLFAFSGWEDYVDAVHTPWLRVVLPCVLLLLAASFIPRDVIPGWLNRRAAQRAISNARAVSRPQDISIADARTLLAHSLSLAHLRASAPTGSMPRVPLIYFDLAQYGLAVPPMILDRRIASEVLNIKRPVDLLEPEPIESGASRWHELLTWIWMPPLTILYWLFGTSRFVLALFLLVSGGAIASQLLRWARTGVAPGASGFVAGVGYLEGPNGKRLASESVITVISKPRWRPMRVRLLAPTWNLDLLFHSPRDPGFIAFWQRWNHPHPRPELLGDSASRQSL